MSSSVALAEAPTSRSAPLSIRMASAIASKRDSDISAAAREKLKVCLLDFLACAFEASALPWPGRRRGSPRSEPDPAPS
jgi:hypothetical protein